MCRQLLAIGSLIAVLAAPNIVHAADFIVNSVIDGVDALPGDGVCATLEGDCTLRAAIQETNALVGPDRVFLPAGVFLLTLTGADEDAGASGDLDITGALDLHGAGADHTLIDGNRRDRVVDIRGAQVQISTLTIQNGRTDGAGGGIRIPRTGGHLSISDSTVWHNVAEATGGGIFIDRFTTAEITRTEVSYNRTFGRGGGVIAADGGLQITDSEIHRNRASIGGGILSGMVNVIIMRSTIHHNVADVAGGVWRRPVQVLPTARFPITRQIPAADSTLPF